MTDRLKGQTAGRTARLFSCLLVMCVSRPAVPYAQPAATDNATPIGAAQSFNTEQFDALLAPVALYPDTLLTQVLMAATFPLEIVQAARWADDPVSKTMTGDALIKALQAQPWDPSVKSLVPFPEVLALMNGNLDWTQQLGYAFADQQGAVMDSVQRLRRQAQASGSLESTPQQVVRTERQTIGIEPAQPDVVYVPSYTPTTVYGAWPYPSYPPVYLPPPPGYPVGTAPPTGLAFGAGVAITADLWNWARPVWGGGSGSGYVTVNVNRYNNLNANHAAIHSNVWQPNRAGGRPAGLQRPPGGPVGAPARLSGLPAGAVGRSQVSVPGSAVRPSARPGGAQGGEAVGAGAGAGAGVPERTVRNNPGRAPSGLRQNASNRSTGSQQIANRAPPQRARPPAQGTFSGVNEGYRTRQFSERGGQSRAAQQVHGGTAGGSSTNPGGAGDRPDGRQ
jgi:hypothetical protein